MRPFLALAMACAIALALGCNKKQANPTTGPANPKVADRIRPPAGLKVKDGIAAAILIDTSGSMGDSVRDGDVSRPKIDIARRAALNIVRQTQTFAQEQPDQPTLLGLYEFSGRDGQADCREIVSLSAPNPSAAEGPISALKADGNTPIGEALIRAKNDLDRSGLSRRHILILTDGENTKGLDATDVMKAIVALPEAQRPGVYFVAFDVDANVFAGAKACGALVLPAADAKELQERLDFIIGNKILLEK